MKNNNPILFILKLFDFYCLNYVHENCVLHIRSLKLSVEEGSAKGPSYEQLP